MSSRSIKILIKDPRDRRSTALDRSARLRGQNSGQNARAVCARLSRKRFLAFWRNVAKDRSYASGLDSPPGRVSRKRRYSRDSPVVGPSQAQTRDKHSVTTTTTIVVVVIKQLKIERTGGVIKPADANGWSGRMKDENASGEDGGRKRRERERERRVIAFPEERGHCGKYRRNMLRANRECTRS